MTTQTPSASLSAKYPGKSLVTLNKMDGTEKNFNMVKKWLNPSPYERRDAALGWKVILEDVVKNL